MRVMCSVSFSLFLSRDFSIVASPGHPHEEKMLKRGMSSYSRGVAGPYSNAADGRIAHTVEE